MTAHDEPMRWGNRTVPATVRGHPAKVFEPRRHSLPELLLDARRWGDRPYLVQGGRRISFSEHERRVAFGAALLRAKGVGPGDRLLIAGVNGIEWVVAFWSVLAVGAVAALANFWWSDEELASAVNDLQPVYVVSDSTRLAKVPEGSPTLDMRLFDSDADSSLVPLDLPDIREDDPAIVIFTSGSTGKAKGALLSHHGMIAAQQNLLVGTGRLPQQIPDDHPAIVSMLTAPLFHLGGVGPLITGLLVGGTVVFLDGKFDAGEVLELIERERVTVWGGVPTAMQRMLDHPDRERRETSSLRTVALGGAPVPPQLPERIRTAFPSVRTGVSEVYGMTETSGFVATASGRELLDRPGTTGRIMPVVEARIDNPDSRGVGEIIVRGPTVMLGYLAETTPSIDESGFFHTGDLGRFDGDGYLYITGRLKDVIIRGGENIAARHVEETIAQHPAVSEVAVVALPNRDLGEEVGAAVVVSDQSATARDLADFIRPSLAYFEVPSQWWLRTVELPTTAFGKPDKVKIRQEWPYREDDYAGEG